MLHHRSAANKFDRILCISVAINDHVELYNTIYLAQYLVHVPLRINKSDSRRSKKTYDLTASTAFVGFAFQSVPVKTVAGKKSVPASASIRYCMYIVLYEVSRRTVLYIGCC